MTSTLRRAGGFAAVGTLALAAPVLGQAAFAPFAAVAVFAAFLTDEGPLFDLFARPGDYEDGQLNGLAGFALAATALALLATVPTVSEVAMPVGVFVGTVLILSYGNVGTRLAEAASGDPFVSTAGFAAAGFLAGVAGQAAVSWTRDTTPLFPRFAFLAATGALVGALLRSVLFERDDPIVMVSVGLLLWLVDGLTADVTAVGVAAALGVTIAFGYASYALGTASVPGMLTGVLLGLVTIILGGFGWFAVLLSFFAIGGLSTKFQYSEKHRRGVAEGNDGARGSGNVLGNAAVALVAVLGFAASRWVPVDASVFYFAFAGSVAAAMSDTLSSEIGGLFDNPRLITTLRPVEPGTDGGVTWQGEVAGVVGAGIVAVISSVLFPFAGVVGAVVVFVGGVAGMTVDSLLGATVEGDRIGNQSVNFLATLSGAVVSAALALLAVGRLWG